MILDCGPGTVGRYQNSSPTEMQAGIAQKHKIVEDKTNS